MEQIDSALRLTDDLTAHLYCILERAALLNSVGHTDGGIDQRGAVMNQPLTNQTVD